ncbi:unnamed protein product, partial [Staurois parvus]
MAECGDGNSSDGEAVQGPMRHCGPWQQIMRRRGYRGTWQSVRWRQQQWEAVQGPMRHSGPGSSM